MSETTEWSRSWNASSDPTKQRKYRRNAPHHQRKQFLNAHVADTVQERIGTRSVPVRTGDKVEVMRGDHAGETGRVDDIDTEDAKIYVDGVERESVDGSDVNVAVDPSNVKVTKLDLDDPQRLAEYDVSEDAKEEIGVEPEEEAGDDETGEEPATEDAETDGDEQATDTDPDDIVTGTVDEVKDAVEAGADPGAVLEAEQANMDRVTLVDWLEARVDGDTDE